VPLKCLWAGCYQRHRQAVASVLTRGTEQGGYGSSKGQGVCFFLASWPASCSGLRLEHKDKSGALMGTPMSVGQQRCPDLCSREEKGRGGCSSPYRSCSTRNEMIHPVT